MAFSKATMTGVLVVAERARSMWQGAVQVGFDFISLITMLLGFLMENCGKKTEASRKAQLRKAYNDATANGVSGCIEAITTPERAKKLRKKLARKKGLKTRALQDAHVYNALSAANVEREATLSAMGSVYDNDETDDEND